MPKGHRLTALRLALYFAVDGSSCTCKYETGTESSAAAVPIKASSRRVSPGSCWQAMCHHALTAVKPVSGGTGKSGSKGESLVKNTMPQMQMASCYSRQEARVRSRRHAQRSWCCYVVYLNTKHEITRLILPPGQCKRLRKQRRRLSGRHSALSTVPDRLLSSRWTDTEALRQSGQRSGRPGPLERSNSTLGGALGKHPIGARQKG